MAKAERSGVGSGAFLEVNLCKQFSPSVWPDGESKPRRCSFSPLLLAACPLNKQPAIVSSEAGCFCLGVGRGPQKGLFNRGGTRKNWESAGMKGENIFCPFLKQEHIFCSDFKEPESSWDLEYVRLSLKSDNSPIVLKYLLPLLF